MSMIAHTAKLQIGDAASPETFTTIGKISSIGAFGEELTVVEATHLNSANFLKGKIPGLLDAGGVEFVCHADPSEATQTLATGFKKAVRDRAAKNWRIVAPVTSTTNATYAFSGFAKSWKLNIGVSEDLQELSGGIEFTTQPTETVA